MTVGRYRFYKELLRKRLHAATAPPPNPRIPGTSEQQQAQLERMEKIRDIMTETANKVGIIYMGNYVSYDEHFCAVFAALMDGVERMEALEDSATSLAVGEPLRKLDVESVYNASRNLQRLSSADFGRDVQTNQDPSENDKLD